MSFSVSARLTTVQRKMTDSDARTACAFTSMAYATASMIARTVRTRIFPTVDLVNEHMLNATRPSSSVPKRTTVYQSNTFVTRTSIAVKTTNRTNLAVTVTPLSTPALKENSLARLVVTCASMYARISRKGADSCVHAITVSQW